MRSVRASDFNPTVLVLSTKLAHQYVAASIATGTPSDNISRTPAKSPAATCPAPDHKREAGVVHDPPARTDNTGSTSDPNAKFRNRCGANGIAEATPMIRISIATTTTPATSEFATTCSTAETSGRCRPVMWWSTWSVTC
ncbi:hypothetical protein B7C42_08003 [Nocardia cerradoensis]|uniref:Uncharacterized protein n=1 Tax=Nocardia cerradoensis TaxID=85688 RepID=A0A231GTJ1_9NOCA|nr:hypothetical protein B7C42_08003 [Nocardia cerradoensis]